VLSSSLNRAPAVKTLWCLKVRLHLSDGENVDKHRFRMFSKLVSCCRLPVSLVLCQITKYVNISMKGK
jgi:hypothetical protein